MSNENPTAIADSLRRVFRTGGALVDGAAGTFAGTAWSGDLCVRTDAGNQGLYINTNTQASPTWVQISSGGVTLDGAYDYGGAGSGKAITVDSGAVALTNNAANNNGVLTLEKSPVGAQSGNVLTITVGAQATGAALVIANSGSGNDITGSSSTWSVTAAGLVTATNVALLEGTAPAGTVVYVARDNDGDAYINALVGKSVIARVAGTAVATFAGAAITLAQATTISTGGLTVAAGGATVTGNSTITGNLEVTGSLTFGGNWTVAATLTVDELVLDTDGVAPAGTNCYAVRDNAGDLTVNAVTGKQVLVAINNTDEYGFSATAADFNGNDMDNVGYIEFNATTLPVAGDAVWLGHDNTGDLTLNARDTKAVRIAINGTDEIAFTQTATVFNEASADRDYRFETGGLQYAIYSDGGKDCVVLGDNTDISSADLMVVVGNVAKTASNNGSTAIFKVVATASFTGQGTNPVMASAWFSEPNLTAGGATITNAATVYIENEPTEGGTGNYGLMVVASIGLIADAKDFVIGAGRDVLMRWSTADADNHAFAVGLGASLAMHICQAADIATDWNVAADVNPTLYVHGAATPATEYVAISTDETDAHLNAVGANWKFEIGGTAELTLAANALNLVDSILYGSAASHTADTADGCLYLHSTSDATKGFVCVPNAQLGLVIGSDGSVDRAGTVGTNTLSLFNGTAPAGTLANGVTFYSEGGEAKVLDAAGNSTTLSPHTDDGDYVIHSFSYAKNETVTIHLEKMLKALAQTPALSKFVEVKAGHSKRPVWA